MVDEKLFYKYHSLKVAVDDDGKVIKDDNGHDIIYAIQNLANNQLYFNDPTKFNDPFDCKFDVDMKGTLEQWIDHCKKLGHNNVKALRLLDDGINNGFIIKQDNFYYCDIIKLMNSNIDAGLVKKEECLVYGETCRKSHKRIAREMNDFIKNTNSYGVCCFTDTPKNILMWSHYADYHQGICISFRSRKGNIWEHGLTGQFLSLYKPSTMEIKARGVFSEVNYEDDLPEPANIFDMSDTNKWFKFLQTKFSDWHYENEYRIILPHTYFENQILKYQKKSLEGVIFGLYMSSENAKLVYDTIERNYLDKGFAVNFYKAKEVPRKYALKIELIKDIKKYINNPV